LGKIWGHSSSYPTGKPQNWWASSMLKNCSPAMHLPHAMHMGTHYAIHIDWVVVGSNQLHKATCMPCHAQGLPEVNIKSKGCSILLDFFSDLHLLQRISFMWKNDPN